MLCAINNCACTYSCCGGITPPQRSGAEDNLDNCFRNSRFGGYNRVSCKLCADKRQLPEDIAPFLAERIQNVRA